MLRQSRLRRGLPVAGARRYQPQILPPTLASLRKVHCVYLYKPRINRQLVVLTSGSLPIITIGNGAALNRISQLCAARQLVGAPPHCLGGECHSSTTRCISRCWRSRNYQPSPEPLSLERRFQPRTAVLARSSAVLTSSYRWYGAVGQRGSSGTQK